MRLRRAVLLSLPVGAAVALYIGGVPGLIIGAVATPLVVLILRRTESPESRAERRQALADLPIAADLLSAAMASGSPPDRAALIVGSTLSGPVGDRLVSVASALRQGVLPAEAWQLLAEVPGGARLARAAARSADRGTALIRVFDRQATDLRAARAASAQSDARRVGVLIVLPLSLCFLPAFLVGGVIPIVIAILHTAIPRT